MGSFFFGLNTHIRAVRLLLTDVELRRLAVAPLLINVILFLVAIPVAVWGVTGWIGHLLGDPGGWAGAGVVVLQIIAGVAVVTASFILFGIIGAAVAGPFSGPLSEAVEKRERERLGLEPMVVASRGVVRDVGRALVYALGRLLLFLAVYPLIFLLQFIPGVGPVLFGVLAFLYSAFVLSVDFTDPTLDRYIDDFRDKLQWVWQRKALSLGFGAGCVILLLIPIVNLAMIPVCVVGGTLTTMENGAPGAE